MPLYLPKVAFLGALTVLVVLGSFASAQADEAAKCIPMSEMTSIVFQQGMTQSRRRSSNVPTLQCVGNCPSDAPALLQAHCTRQGLDDYGKPTWRCVPQFAGGGGAEGQSSGPRRFGLGMIRVECEGCTKAGDPNIVQGSCTLKYSVTSAGGRRDTGRRRRRGESAGQQGYHDSHHTSPFNGFFVFFFIVSSFFVLAALFRRCWSERNNAYSPHYYGNGGTATSYPAATYDQHDPGVVMGKPVGGLSAGGAVHHHHHNHIGGGGGGGGFGTGMLTGFILGDVISRSMHHGHYMHGAYEGRNTDWGGDNGHDNDEGFDAGGFGGTDSI